MPPRARKDGSTIKVPVGKKGNKPGDTAWIAAETAEGRLIEIEASEEGVPYGVKLRYDGTAEEAALSIGSFWSLPDEAARCRGRSKIRDDEGRWVVDSKNVVLTRQCANWPIRGADVCIAHGGGLDSVRNAAKLRLIAAADVMVGALIEIALSKRVDDRTRVMAINSALDRAGIKAGVEVDINIPQWQKTLRSLFEDTTDEDDEDDGPEPFRAIEPGPDPEPSPNGAGGAGGPDSGTPGRRQSRRVARRS